jgi:hypothetical protein
MNNEMLSSAPSPRAALRGPVGPHRLLAVRVAGAAFDGPYNLRSARFAALLEERSCLRATLAETRDALTEALHAAVPGAPDRDTRRLLIALKRDVFNGRFSRDTAMPMPPELTALFATYTRLAEDEAALLDRHRTDVLNETRDRVARLLEDARFRLACFHSSPDLCEQLAHATPPARVELTSLERGLHAYAAKFISKASPFHLFGSLLFPPGAAIRPDGAHEVVVDGGAILEMERQVLPHVRDPGRVWVHLRTFVVDGPSYRFWVPSPDGFRVVALRDTPLLRALVSLLRDAWERTGRPTLTRADCEARLRAVVLPESKDQAAALLDRLSEHGILTEYLVTDFAEFAPALLGTVDELDATIGRLQRHHLARVAAADLPRVDSELGGADARGSVAPVWINSYSDADPAPHLAAAERVFADLHDLAPCFAVEHNFSASAYVVRALVRDLLGDAPGATAPYLDVLRHFLRGRDEVLARYHPGRHRPLAERSARAAWFASAAGHSGRLTRSSLRALRAFARTLGPRPHLCFNGPFDYAAEVLYLSNVFAGGGRFAARYLLHRGTEPPALRQGAPGGAVDVELALAPHPNMNYVVRRFPAGCGFEARYAHRYDRWVEPSEVVFALEDGRLAYRHAGTGEELRFHHSGFLLGQFLPAEYQLLLAGHADTFRNPFLGSEPQGPEAEVRYRPGLRYGTVVLRRDRWDFRRGVLAGLVPESDPLRFAALLRDWVHERVRPEDGWYYRVARTGALAHKPLYLDLLNPLSVQAFRRELRAVPDSAAMSLTVAAPAASGMVRHGGAPHVSELMIEV